ncbi:conjugal transfer protein [Streptococcus pasteurianus]|uniref:Conjugal transfer protein n=1 Tax=Enterococcus cecorum TaxID=44008 RepID=A0A7X9NNW1_9ENTE|nr:MULTISPECIES: conjugal transfer protein [Lactobacillales]HAP3402795.1 conjugal transfer protein [Enterococcus faecalis]MDV7822670.1 conjugal transfer protein [Enterococcus gallinarum]NME46488.1 conjugal transfer protein [Enterococcus gallinarum]NME50590.1 conjugal transfer protein [Enterococcus cecorum]WOO58557.1 conjugal transfer protein [Streptococcus pasteurianus]
MFKKKENQKKQGKEKIPAIKVGTHKKMVVVLWVIMISSLLFGVYKNFTAVDQHTIHEKEIIELTLNDTNGIENFVKNFAKSYYTWSNNKESIEARKTAISYYLTEELQRLNADTVRTDIPTSSAVKDILVWKVEEHEDHEYIVTYEVHQQINEGNKKKEVKATYTVAVYVDSSGDMVIVKNPTIAPMYKKSSYEPKAIESDGSVDPAIINEATSFLDTFFKLYPSATDKELAYYVSCNVLKEIKGDYIYSKLINPVFTKDGENLKVNVSVEFIDRQTKAIQISQFDLTLHKDSNWKIIQ